MNVQNLPTAPAPDSLPLAAVHSQIMEQITELQGDLLALLEELSDGTPARFVLGDIAGDIRGNACHLWDLLVSVQNGGK